MNVSTSVTASVQASPEAVFDLANDVARTPEVFVRHGPIPGVCDAEVVGGGELGRGRVRRITIEDGAVMDETMLTFDRGSAVGYRLEGMGKPFSLLVRHGEASWRFVAANGATTVDWTYTFELTTPLVWPIATLIVSSVFRPWMRHCLTRLSQLATEKP